LFHCLDFGPEGWHNPRIPAKFISPDGKKLSVYTAGNLIRRELGLYRLRMIPGTLEV